MTAYTLEDLAWKLDIEPTTCQIAVESLPTNMHVFRKTRLMVTGLYTTRVPTASVMGRAYPGARDSIEPWITPGFFAAKYAASTA